MSLKVADTLIEKLKSDDAFCQSVFESDSVTTRLATCRDHGFDCSEQDLASLQKLDDQPQDRPDSLPLSWQCKGPCHTRCSDVF